MGHVLMENRRGQAIEAEPTRAAGHAERLAALAIIEWTVRTKHASFGGDKGCDTRNFVMELCEINITPHVAHSTSSRHSAIDSGTTRHAGNSVNQRIRMRIEEVFGWTKIADNLRKTRHRGLERVRWVFTLTAAAYNPIRLPKLLAAAP